MIVIKEMNMPKDCDNCWFNYIQSLQRGTSKTYCAMELTKRMYQALKEIDSNKYIYPIYGADGKIIIYEVYDKCTKSIERLHAYGVDYKLYGSDVDDNQWITCPKLQHKDG